MDDTNISRYEFDKAMSRIEALLKTQTEILIKISTAETDNKYRDARINDIDAKAEKAVEQTTALKIFQAKVLGATTVVIFLTQIALKKFGM